MTQVKFCGLTRPEDAREGAALGASYLGAIFAGGPRLLSPARARELFAAVPAGPQRVGVFADQGPAEIADVAETARLDIVQLHGGATPERVEAARAASGRKVWAVIRVRDAELPPEAPELFAVADAVLVDALVPGQLGGTGVTLPWLRLADAVVRARRDAAGRLVLAVGLTPGNVREAIAAIAPDVVDVSSGVESAPGIKDHQLLRAFRDAVLGSDG